MSFVGGPLCFSCWGLFWVVFLFLVVFWVFCSFGVGLFWLGSSVFVLGWHVSAVCLYVAYVCGGCGVTCISVVQVDNNVY
jgi:hypothetical protein